MTIETTPFNGADYFKKSEDQAWLINDAIESGDAGYLAHALGVVARARGMTDVARDVGVKRQQLYKALSRDGNPTLSTIIKVLDALGLKIQVVDKAEAA